MGGRYTPGVVRVGGTVRRPSSEASGFIRILLTHLENVGFHGSPRYLGLDEGQRDILSYIPGWVPEKFQKFTNEQIGSVGALLKRFHQATKGCHLVGTKKVICHHDPGPNNTVFQNGEPVAFIDFDFAAPGDPIEDLGYMAWSWCVSSKPERGPASFQAIQVRALADSYDLNMENRHGILDSILERQSRNIKFWSERVNTFNEALANRDEIIERINWSHRELDFTRTHKNDFLSALN